MKKIIHRMNLRSIDLNLLAVFDAIVAEGNQSRAAKKLGMSQPAMSNALGRLRGVVDDPLFVRTMQGMVPTSRARALAEPIRQALDLIQAGLDRAKNDNSFEPNEATRSFVLAVDDYGDAVIMPRLLDWILKAAPGVSIRIRRETSKPGLTQLASGGIDISIQYFRVRDSGLVVKHLIDEEFVSMVRNDHPTVGESLSLAQYTALPHVVFGRLGGKGIRNTAIDRQLRQLGLTRNIAMQVPGFQSMPVIVQATDCICTLPRRMAHAYAHFFRLKVLKPPLDLPPLQLYMIWSKTMGRDPAHEWLRNALYGLCQRL